MLNPNSKKMMIDRGSLAIRFVENPTEETKQVVMNDNRFIDIRSQVRSTWGITTSVIDEYNADKQQIDQDIRKSEQIWKHVKPETMDASTLKRLTDLAVSLTDRSDNYIRQFRKEGTAQQHKDIYQHLISFGQMWDKKLAEWEAAITK